MARVNWCKAKVSLLLRYERLDGLMHVVLVSCCLCVRHEGSTFDWCIFSVMLSCVKRSDILKVANYLQ